MPFGLLGVFIINIGTIVSGGLSIVNLILFCVLFFIKKLRFKTKTYLHVVVTSLFALAACFAIGYFIAGQVKSEQISQAYANEPRQQAQRAGIINKSWQEADQAEARQLIVDCKVKILFVNALPGPSYIDKTLDKVDSTNGQQGIRPVPALSALSTKSGVTISRFGITDGDVYMAVSPAFGRYLGATESYAYQDTISELKKSSGCRDGHVVHRSI